jgi:RND family efflux transporter MFP subunit
MRRQTKRILLILAILIGATLIAVAMTALRQEPPKKPRDELAMLVDVMVLKTMEANFVVQSQGTVLPRTETVLSAEVSGTITSISPKYIAGGVFEAGETLMRIDPTNYTVAVLQAEALVEQREIEHEGAKKLRSQGYRAESEYASAKAALATAKSELVRARRNLEQTYIRLPYDGMVRSKEVDLGQFVSPGMRLGVVFATDHAEVRLPLTDLDLAFVDLPKPGVSNGPGVTLSAIQKGKRTEWRAMIVRTEGVVDEKSRVTYAVARIDDPYALRSDGAPLPMGSFVNASIEGAVIDNIIQIPRSVLRGSDQLIFVDDDDRLRIRSVDIARSDAEFVYVGGGASAGERIVTTTLEQPFNGMKVRLAGAE